MVGKMRGFMWLKVKSLSMNEKIVHLIFVIGFIGLMVNGIYQITRYHTDLAELEQISEEIPFQKGMSFTTWENFAFNKTWVKEEFQKMKETGIEWVAINHWWWQDYLNSTEIKQGPWSDGYTNMTECFLYAKAIGLHVMYKPMLNLLLTYEWRSYIQYTEDWMGNYTEWLVQNAIAAQAGEVEILCIGTEMGNMQIHSEGVRNMIAQIRQVYTGLLTYSANHDSFTQIDWYDALDIIGVSMYTMMTTEWDPSVQQLTAVWNGMYNELEELAIRWKKPLMFTEIGIQARDGSNLIPNDNQISTKRDISEMRNYYLSLFESKIWNAPWFKGAYWWIWDRAQADDTSLDSFNPVLIQDTIQAQYIQPHDIVKSDMKFVIDLIPIIMSSGMVVVLLIYIYGRDQEVNNEDKDKLYGDISLGLVLGCFISLMWTNLTIHLFKVIRQAVTYAIIFQLSLTSAILTFLGVILVSGILSVLVVRYYPPAGYYLVFLLMLGIPYFSLMVEILGIFTVLFLDLWGIFMILGLSLQNFLGKQLKDPLRVIGTTVLVVTGFMGLISIFGAYTQVILTIPLGLAYLFDRNLKDSKDPIPIQQEQSIPHVNILLLGGALLMGMLIPFGNSNINLINMNLVNINAHYFPAMIGAVIITAGLLYFMNVRKNFDFGRLYEQFTPENLIYISVLGGLIGIPFLLLGRPPGVWGIISGILIVVFFGTLVRTAQYTFNQSRFGRNYVYLVFIAIFFVLGFILNGIKGFYVYTVTFLIIKDGQILRRDPSIDPVPPFDVPLVLNGIILFAVILIASILIGYIFLKKKVRRVQLKTL
jgi:hypothetical protein